jgi:hypothetical protein
MAQYLEPGTMLSTGSMNATIDTYNPGISFRSGGTISIIYKGNVIATIRVENNDNSTLAKYTLKGDEESLRRFKVLCNTYITDKSPYLRYNGLPASLPAGFAPREKDSEDRPYKPFPVKEPQFAFDEMMQALNEAEREPLSGESGAAARPLRTIYLLVSMHGARLETMPLAKDLPINETYAYAPGKCPILKVSTLYQIARIKKYRSLSTDEIVSGYSRDISLKEKEEIDRYSVLYDHHYQCDTLNNANVFSNGIFIIGSNFLDPAVFGPVEVEGQMEVEYSQFPTAQYELNSAMDLQKINLINVHVLEELSHRVTGTKFSLKPQPKDLYFSITKDDTGLPHYFNSQLSHYLRYCQELGAEKVVLLDETCRIRSFREGVAADERAAAEELGYGTLISRPYDRREMRDSRKGGKRTKRKRTRRSRRSHKKS